MAPMAVVTGSERPGTNKQGLFGARLVGALAALIIVASVLAVIITDAARSDAPSAAKLGDANLVAVELATTTVPTPPTAAASSTSVALVTTAAPAIATTTEVVATVAATDAPSTTRAPDVTLGTTPTSVIRAEPDLTIGTTPVEPFDGPTLTIGTVPVVEGP